MADLIDRQEAIDALDGEITVTGIENAKTVKEYIRSVNLKIRGLPSAQPERKKGRWIEHEAILCTIIYECDQCGKLVTKHKYNFCPNCGSDMRGE